MLTYDLYVDDEHIESATLEQPLRWCFGHGRMLQRFEDLLAGKDADDTFDFVIPAAEAYGPYRTDGLVSLDKKMFEEDGRFDAEQYAVGATIHLRSADGAVFQARISKVDDSVVEVDLNHRLAGKNLHFTGRIIDVRPATDDELAALTQCGCGGGCHGGCGGQGCNAEGGCCGC